MGQPQQAISTNETNPYLVMLVVGLGTLLSALAGSTIILALPSIGAEFNISVELTGWVIAAYLLTVTAFLLLSGRIGDLIGHRIIYIIGFLLFGTMSFGCGISNGFGWLVASRLLQGIGGAMLMANSPALLTLTFPASRRGWALGMVSTATYIGLTVGPPLGGLIISTLGWRWLFFLNVPSTVIIVILGLIYLPKYPKKAKDSLDAKGTMAIIMGLPCALVSIVQGPHWGWTSWRTLTFTALGFLFIALFIFIESRLENPLIKLSLFKSKVFTGATISAMCNYIALFVPIVLVPYYLVEGLGLSDAKTGFFMSAQPFVMALVASPSGRLSDRIGSRGLATLGMAILSVGIIGLSRINLNSGDIYIILCLAIMGLGTGVFISPNSSALMGSAPREQQGVAAGVMAVARNLGMMLGVAAAMTIFKAAGGSTAHRWVSVDFEALNVALLCAGAVAFIGAGASALRGVKEPLILDK